MADENEVVAPTAEEIAEARGLGWADRPEWRGAPEHWVDAKTFLEKGRHVLPIMSENNKRLKGEVELTNAKVDSLQNSLRAAQATIDALEESHEADVLAAAEAARAKLKDELAEASREGRHEDVADLTLQIGELNKAEQKPANKKEEQLPAPQVSPAFIAWANKNPTFVSDPRRMALAQVVSAEIREKDKTTVGDAFMDLVADEVDKLLGARGGRSSKAENGGGTGNRRLNDGGGEEQKTYADLPSDAKAACERQAKRLVGEGRTHKTIESWRKTYATKYFAQE